MPCGLDLVFMYKKIGSLPFLSALTFRSYFPERRKKNEETTQLGSYIKNDLAHS
jgi:hypothetical protein